MLLTIDAGNTRTKWATFNHNGEILQYGACLNEQLTTADLNPESLSYERVIISNVAGKAHAAQLTKKLAPYHLSVHWVSASVHAGNVFNCYSEPETLGTDRWAALVAAWNMGYAPCVVVNAGTAVTIDALHCQSKNHQQGEFMGGMILPGLILMQTNLGLGTAQLPTKNAAQNFDENTHVTIFAKSTLQAIKAGALNAIAGAIERMANALEAKCKQAPLIVLSGGDAPAIQSYLAAVVTNPTVIVDNLVLQGLYLLEKSTPD